MSAGVTQFLAGLGVQPEPMSPISPPEGWERVSSRAQDGPHISNNTDASLHQHAPISSPNRGGIGEQGDVDSRQRKRRRSSRIQRRGSDGAGGTAWAGVYPPRPRPHSPLERERRVPRLWAPCPAAVSANDGVPRSTELEALGRRLASCFGRSLPLSGARTAGAPALRTVQGSDSPEKSGTARQRPNHPPTGAAPEAGPTHPVDTEQRRQASPPADVPLSGNEGEGIHAEAASAASAAPVGSPPAPAAAAPASADAARAPEPAEASSAHVSRKWGLLQPHEESVAFRLALTRQKRPGPYPRWSSLSVVEHLALAWLESRLLAATRQVKGKARTRLVASVNAAAPSGKRAWAAVQPCWSLSRHLQEQKAVGGRPTVTRYEKAVHAALAKRAAIERALVGQWVEETAADTNARVATAFAAGGAEVATRSQAVVDLALRDYASAYDRASATQFKLRVGAPQPGEGAGGAALSVECTAVRGSLPPLHVPDTTTPPGAGSHGDGSSAGAGEGSGGGVRLVSGGTDAKTLAPSPIALRAAHTLSSPHAAGQRGAAPLPDTGASSRLRCSEDAVMAEVAALCRADAACDILALECVVAAALPGSRSAAAESVQGGPVPPTVVPCRVVRSKAVQHSRQRGGATSGRPRRRRPTQSLRSVFFDAPLPWQGGGAAAAATAAGAAAAADAVRFLGGTAPADNPSLPDQGEGEGDGARATLCPGAARAMGGVEGLPPLGEQPPERQWPPYSDQPRQDEQVGDGATRPAPNAASAPPVRAAYFLFSLGDRRVLVRAPVVGTWAAGASGDEEERLPVPGPVAVVDTGPLPLLRPASHLEVASLVCRSACAGRAFAPLARLDGQSASLHCLQLVGDAWWRQAGGPAVEAALSSLLDAAVKGHPGENLLLVQPGTTSLLPAAAPGAQSAPLASFLAPSAPQSPDPWASAAGVPPQTVLPDGLAGLLPPRPRQHRCENAVRGTDCSCPRLLAGGCSDAMHVGRPAMHSGRVVFPVWLLTGADELSAEAQPAERSQGREGSGGASGEADEPGGDLHPAAARVEALPRMHEGPVLHCLRCTPLRNFCEAFAMEGRCADAQCAAAHVPEEELARDVMSGACTVDSSPPVRRRKR